MGCEPRGCKTGGGQSIPAPDANTNPGAVTQERSRELGVSRSTVVGGRSLFYLPSLAFPTPTAFPHNFFQCVTAIKEVTVISAFDRDCRTPCLHAVTLDPSELSQVNIVASLCRVFHSLYQSKACEYLSCQIHTCILKM